MTGHRASDAASAVGRDPAAITRFLNVSGQFTPTGGGLLVGPAEQWAEQLSEIALTHGTSGFILVGDDPGAIDRYAHEVAPASGSSWRRSGGRRCGDGRG